MDDALVRMLINRLDVLIAVLSDYTTRKVEPLTIDGERFLSYAEILAEGKIAREKREQETKDWLWDASGQCVEFCTCDQGKCFVHGKGLNAKR